VTGCGQNRTYKELVMVGAVTVDGTDYHVMDPHGRTRGYKKPTSIRPTTLCTVIRSRSE